MRLEELNLRERTEPPIIQRQRRGGLAEQLVANFLRDEGLDVVAMNLRLGAFELDIVARDGPLLIVVEVRSRGPGSWTSAFGSLDAAKRRRVRKAGQWLWDRRYRNDASVERMRFDAASVTFTPEGPRIEYVRAAF